MSSAQKKADCLAGMKAARMVGSWAQMKAATLMIASHHYEFELWVTESLSRRWLVIDARVTEPATTFCLVVSLKVVRQNFVRHQLVSITFNTYSLSSNKKIRIIQSPSGE